MVYYFGVYVTFDKKEKKDTFKSRLHIVLNEHNHTKVHSQLILLKKSKQRGGKGSHIGFLFCFL